MENWSPERAFQGAMNRARSGEVVPITPKSLEYPGDEFDDETELELRRLMMQEFKTIVSATDPGQPVFCTGEAVHSSGQKLHLLAQNSPEGQIVYLISPSHSLSA